MSAAPCAIIDAEFVRCVTNMCLYFRRDSEDLVVVGVYVDILLATRTSAAAVEKLLEGLAKLQINDLSHVHKFLGMRDDLCDDGGYRIDQEDAI